MIYLDTPCGRDTLVTSRHTCPKRNTVALNGTQQLFPLGFALQVCGAFWLILRQLQKPIGSKSDIVKTLKLFIPAGACCAVLGLARI